VPTLEKIQSSIDKSGYFWMNKVIFKKITINPTRIGSLER